MRSPNLGTAAIALSNVVLVIFFVVEGINDGRVKCVPVIFLHLLKNVSIKREQSQTYLCYVECKKGRMKSKRKISVKYCSGRL